MRKTELAHYRQLIRLQDLADTMTWEVDRLKAYVADNDARLTAHFETVSPTTHRIVTRLLTALTAIATETHDAVLVCQSDAERCPDLEAVVDRAEAAYYPRMQTVQQLLTLAAESEQAARHKRDAADLAKSGWFQKGLRMLGSAVVQLRFLATVAGWLASFATITYALGAVVTTVVAAAGATLLWTALLAAVTGLVYHVSQNEWVRATFLQLLVSFPVTRSHAAIKALYLKLYGNATAAVRVGATSIGTLILGTRVGDTATVADAVDEATAAVSGLPAAVQAAAAASDGPAAPVDSGNPVANLVAFIVTLGLRLVTMLVSLWRVASPAVASGIRAAAPVVARGLGYLFRRGAGALKSGINHVGALMRRRGLTEAPSAFAKPSAASLLGRPQLTDAQIEKMHAVSPAVRRQLTQFVETIQSRGDVLVADVVAVTAALEAELRRPQSPHTLTGWAWATFVRLAHAYADIFQQGIDVVAALSVAVVDTSLVAGVPIVTIPDRFARPPSDFEACVAEWERDEDQRKRTFDQVILPAERAVEAADVDLVSSAPSSVAASDEASYSAAVSDTDDEDGPDAA
jgi:hypothetical protein